jgi:hypothetical protein
VLLIFKRGHVGERLEMVVELFWLDSAAETQAGKWSSSRVYHASIPDWNSAAPGL